ncbi:MAG: hypothetical protein OZ921_04115 [Sorangiineae bacterium]|nr:hypothetical protein [Polyangiaceae bacterium]MEB2321674.1 hypothetical protein [Sorangiineae bacterium]
MKKTLIMLFLSLTAGCATSFTGSPHVENGRQGCESKCKSQGMEVAGMVYMGEYTDGCVCVVPGQSASRRQLLMAAANGAAAGSAGVVLQMRRQQEENQRQSLFFH